MIYNLYIWKSHGYEQPDIHVQAEASSPLDAVLSVLRPLGIRSASYVLVYNNPDFMIQLQLLGEFSDLALPDECSVPASSASVIDSTVSYDYSW